MFTVQELNNIYALISLANIQGKDALAVAVLQQKISGLIKDNKVEEEKVETENTDK